MSEVSIVCCRDYDPDRVYESVKQSVDLVGGIEKFVQPGQKVLLKPNLLKAAMPEEAVTTHPVFVQAVIRLVKTRTKEIFVGDSPGGLIKTETVYDKCGLTKIAARENVKLVKFDQISKIEGVPFAKIKDEVDVLISLPKFKTHNLTTITAAIKNVFGLVPGLHKVQCHKQAPNFRAFAKLLVNIYRLARPQLNIVDGILAMEGEGPASGSPRQVGLVLASADAVAVDSVICRLIGLDPFSVPSVKFAAELSLGEADLKNIKILGEDLAKVRVEDFKLPKILELYKLPNIALKIICRFIPLAMKIDERKCSRCLMCKNICPQQAIQEVGGKLSVDFKKCILCLCCSEVCPQNAVFLRVFKRRNIE